MKKAFDEGWGGVICKTLSLDSSKVVNVTPRYAKLTVPGAPSTTSFRPFSEHVARSRAGSARAGAEQWEEKSSKGGARQGACAIRRTPLAL